MKFRFVKKQQPLDEAFYYTERLNDQGQWVLVDSSLSYRADVARVRFDRLVESPEETTVTVLEETP